VLYTKIEDTFKCDDCDKTFKGKNIHLNNPATNINIITPPSSFIYIDKDNKITGGGEQPSLEKGDKIVCCPHCKATHLFGLTKI